MASDWKGYDGNRYLPKPVAVALEACVVFLGACGVVNALRQRRQVMKACLVVAALLLVLPACSTRPAPPDKNASTQQVEATAEAPPRSMPPGTQRVVDGSGNAIANATISIDSVKWTAISDSQGYFRLPDLKLKPGKSFSLNVTAPGFLTRNGWSVSGGGTFVDQPDGTIILHKASRIEGIVLGPDGHPLAGAPLALSADENYGIALVSTPNKTHTFTDEHGHFIFDDAPPGEIVVYYPWTVGGCLSKAEVDRHHWNKWTATKGGILTPVVPVKGFVSVVHLTVNNGENKESVVLDLSRSTGAVQGRIVDHRGHAVKGAEVLLYVRLQMSTKGPESVSSCSFTQDISPSCVTNAQGHYRLEHLPPGSWLIGSNIGHANSSYADVRVGTALVDMPDITIDVR